MRKGREVTVTGDVTFRVQKLPPTLYETLSLNASMQEGLKLSSVRINVTRNVTRINVKEKLP